MISQMAVLQALLVLLRLFFDVLDFVPSGICIYYYRTIEKCGKKNILTQKWSNELNATGALIESFNSFILLMLIFKWHKFHTKNYFLAILRLGHFWVWFLLSIANILSQSMVDTVHGKSKEGTVNYSGAGLILELFLLTFLSCAINFISKETFDSWVEESYRGDVAKQRHFSHLYIAVLVAYFVRNIGLFLYDTALVAMSISLINGKPPSGKTKDWDSVILVLMCAFRGSFVKFYFAKMFQGQVLPTTIGLIKDEGFGTFSIITSVFFWLIFRTTCCANIMRRVVFSFMCWCVRMLKREIQQPVDRRPRAAGWVAIV